MTRANQLSFHLLMRGDTIMGLYSYAFQQPIKCLFGISGMLFTGTASNPDLKGSPCMVQNKIQNTNINHWVIVRRDETTWMLHLSSTVTNTVLLSVVRVATNSFHSLSQIQSNKQEKPMVDLWLKLFTKCVLDIRQIIFTPSIYELKYWLG